MHLDIDLKQLNGFKTIREHTQYLFQINLLETNQEDKSDLSELPCAQKRDTTEKYDKNNMQECAGEYSTLCLPYNGFSL